PSWLPTQWRILSCSTMGPSARDGRNVSAPMMMITPMTSTTNRGVCVGNVPADGGTCFSRTSEPASASVGMIRKNLPNSITMASVLFIHAVLAVSPANAEPLLLPADVYAYSSSLKPWAPGLKIDTFLTDPTNTDPAVKASTT